MSSAKPRRLGATAWTAIVAVVALGSSLASLLFDVRPDLKRDPRTRLAAEVSVFAIDPAVTYGQYLEDAAFSAKDLRESKRAACGGKPTCVALAIPGQRVYVRSNIEGFKSRSVSMRLSLYDVQSKTRIEGASKVAIAQEKLESPSSQSVVPAWLICPPDANGRFFVRVEVYYRASRTLLAVGDSKRFRPLC